MEPELGKAGTPVVAAPREREVPPGAAAVPGPNGGSPEGKGERIGLHAEVGVRRAASSRGPAHLARLAISRACRPILAQLDTC